jgi:hypothetical protein
LCIVGANNAVTKTQHPKIPQVGIPAKQQFTAEPESNVVMKMLIVAKL